MSKPLWDEYRYFLTKEDDLAKEHKGKYVAIKGTKILGIFADLSEASRAICFEHEYGTVLMQKIGRGDEYFTGIFPAVEEAVL